MPEYIERDALIHHFKNCIDEVKNTNGCTDDFEICLKAVQNQPTIDTEPVIHGHWKWYEEWSFNGEIRECDEAGWLCSICNRIPSEDLFFDNPDEKPKFDYCPHCGAKMDEE